MRPWYREVHALEDDMIGRRPSAEAHPRAHRSPFLSQHPRQSELRKDAAIGEPRNGRDVVAIKGQHKWRVRMRDVDLRQPYVAAKRRLCVGARGHQPHRRGANAATPVGGTAPAALGIRYDGGPEEGTRGTYGHAL